MACTCPYNPEITDTQSLINRQFNVFLPPVEGCVVDPRRLGVPRVGRDVVVDVVALDARLDSKGVVDTAVPPRFMPPDDVVLIAPPNENPNT